MAPSSGSHAGDLRGAGDERGPGAADSAPGQGVTRVKPLWPHHGNRFAYQIGSIDCPVGHRTISCEFTLLWEPKRLKTWSSCGIRTRQACRRIEGRESPAA